MKTSFRMASWVTLHLLSAFWITGTATATLQEDDQYNYGSQTAFDGGISTNSLVYSNSAYLGSVDTSGMTGTGVGNTANFNDGTTASVVGVGKAALINNIYN